MTTNLDITKPFLMERKALAKMLERGSL